MRNSPLGRVGVGIARGIWVAGLVLLVPASLAAHDIPPSVAILAYVKPEGHRLRLVVRVPLEALRDINWPQRGPGYLELDKVQPLLKTGVETWISNFVRIYEGDIELASPVIAATQISLPSDRSFTAFERAVEHATGAPLPVATDIAWQQAMLDVVLEYDIASDSSRFSINPALARLGTRTTTVLHFLPRSGGERVLQYRGDPGLVRLDPRWTQAVAQFIGLGFRHIMSGLDHLLFVLCLVIPVRRLRPLLAIVTAFTVAHSITLIASASGFAPTALWFPPLIEVLIAASIVYMAFENILGAKVERRWMIAFGFGLVHGFGFSFALRESLQFAGSHLLTSLFAFNVGVELGQVAVLVVAIPVLAWLFSRVQERAGIILLSALVAHTAWHWMTARVSTLSTYSFEWPAMDAAFALEVVRVALLAVILAAAIWLLRQLIARFGTYTKSERLT